MKALFLARREENGREITEDYFEEKSHWQTESHKRTVKALGLRKLNQTVYHKDSSSLRVWLTRYLIF